MTSGNSADWVRDACTRKEITHPLPWTVLQLTAGPNGYILSSSVIAIPLAGNVIISDIIAYTGSAKMSHHETKCAIVVMGENSSALFCISNAQKPRAPAYSIQEIK